MFQVSHIGTEGNHKCLKSLNLIFGQPLRQITAAMKTLLKGNVYADRQERNTAARL
jgi:hypothetical protein